MKLLHWLVLVSGALPGARPQDEGAPAPVPVHADRIDAIVRGFERGEWDAALGDVTELIEVGSALPEWQQAEAQYARGLILLHRAIEAGPESLAAAIHPDAPLGIDWFASASAFGSARALAGPGVLRRHATYDMGMAHLLRAEVWFGTIPEVAQAAQGAPGAGGLPGAPTPISPPGAPPGLPGAPGAPAGEDAPDPLEEARGGYGVAKEHLIQRLREDWRDEDTRANLEWIQRRLRELEEIERQREEQQQEQEPDPNQEPDPDQEPQEDQESEDQEGEDSSEQDSEESEDGEQQPPEESESEEPQDPEESEEGEEESEEEAEPTESETAENEPQEAPRPEEGEGEARSQEQPPAERLLTREEVMRLLDKLAELEEEGEALEAQLQKARRVPVERDW